jgi:predicted dehydrogenase
MLEGRPLRIGILGAARIAPEAIIRPAAARDDVRVVAVAARDHDRAVAFAGEHAIPEVSRDYAALVAREDLDLVYIALPPHLHREWALRAMDAGHHVLCEKPIALDAAEAETMIAASRATGRMLIEAFHYRFHPLMRRAVELARDGAIGRIVRARGWAEYPIPVREGEPRWTAGLGGGALMDLGCYPIHALRTLLDGEPEVTAAQRIIECGVDAEIDASLMFPGGIPASVRASMRPPAPSTGIDLIGERGRIELRGFILAHRSGALRIVRNGTIEDIVADPVTTYAAQLAHVIDQLRGIATAITGGADSLKNMQVIGKVSRKSRIPSHQMSPCTTE